MQKWRCKVCDEITLEVELLHAPNPFNAEDTITGCPACKSCDGFDEICDETGCNQQAQCGFPTGNGYRRTCGKHMDSIKMLEQLQS